jgi:hypothetical protein
MYNLRYATRSAATLFLKVSFSILTVLGLLPTSQANVEIDQVKVQQIADIRFRLIEHNRFVNDNKLQEKTENTEEIIAVLDAIPDWPNWSDWGNGWRNY